MERLFHSQGNNNGTESLVKIIDKPSKADHTASHLRHTPLCEIVTTPDYVNREKKQIHIPLSLPGTARNDSTRRIDNSRKSAIFVAMSSWISPRDRSNGPVWFTETSCLRAGPHVILGTIDRCPWWARARTRKIERSRDRVMLGFQQLARECRPSTCISRGLRERVTTHRLYSRMSHPDRHPINRVLF